jgi:pimeloyl-ACP methyl ester carboxylesterase
MNLDEFFWPVDDAGTSKACVLRSRRRGDGRTATGVNGPTIVVIPGNPGPPHFYHRLMEEMLHCSTSSEIFEMYCLGHTGHTATDKVSQSFSYHEQTTHKLFLLRKHIFGTLGDRRVIFVGHSIGAWICIDMIRQLCVTEEPQVQAVLCLFPTLMHIGSTPNGKTLGPWIGNYVFREASAALIRCVNACCFRRCLFRLVQWAQQGRMDAVDAQVTVEKLLHPDVVRNTMYMGDGEMRLMGKLDSKTIRKHAHKFFFYYGRNDGWTEPLEVHVSEVRKAIGDVYMARLDEMVRVDKHNIPHACTLAPTVKLLARVLVQEFVRCPWILSKST